MVWINYEFIAFSCSAKSFTITILFFSSLFRSLLCFWTDCQNFFFGTFYHLIPRKRVTRIELKFLFFFYQGFLSQTLTIHRIAGEGRGPYFYSTIPLPPALEHWDIYLQHCMWDDYHVFLIATLVFTRLLLDEIYHFCYCDLTLKTGGFELASTIIPCITSEPTNQVC